MLLACLLVLPACTMFSSFQPTPIDEVPFLERAQTATRDGITVTTAVPSREESRRIFGVDLAEERVQPVWIDIQNDSDVPYAFLMTGLDPNYFSAHEAAYTSHFTFRPGTNKKIDAHFEALQLQGVVLPGTRDAGFAFTNQKLGTKEVTVRLFGPGRVEEFDFYAAVPGFRADYHAVDWQELLDRPFTDYPDEEAFRAAIRNLPCCTTRFDGGGKGDPLNLIIIADPDQIGAGLTRAGWDETEKLSFASGWRTFKAFFGGTYKYSPMSALYYDGRSQDAGYQKARDTIHQRNHLRLWLSDMKFQGEHVWVGTITRDVGVYFTLRTWNFTTHAIDPHVDEARGSILEDLANAQVMARFGYEEGIGAATREEPHRNIMNAPWWTDGTRVVIEFSGQRIPIDQIELFYWSWSDDPEQNERINEALRGFRENATP